ncbi:hypothetical protein K4F52_007801 [Lecanicillium sp. MT-2017a]|nr:hypothetical protein K4F52_007801 [Lecanicillium sp. MT-2017a]
MAMAQSAKYDSDSSASSDDLGIMMNAPRPLSSAREEYTGCPRKAVGGAPSCAAFASFAPIASGNAAISWSAEGQVSAQDDYGTD